MVLLQINPPQGENTTLAYLRARLTRHTPLYHCVPPEIEIPDEPPLVKKGLLIAVNAHRYNRNLGVGYIWIPLSTEEPPNLCAVRSERCSTLGVSARGQEVYQLTLLRCWASPGK